MSYGHGPNMTGLKKSAFVTGTWVIFTTQSGKKLRGQVVGPDQDFFPSPLDVWVSFPSSGFTHLLDVNDLELAAKQ